MDGRGKRIPLHWTRQFIADLVTHSKKIPLCTIEKELCLPGIETLRSRFPSRIGWGSIFFKAMGLASQKFQVLRQTLTSFPYPHLYEHPKSIGSMAINRLADERDAVLFGLIKDPGEMSLVEISRQFAAMKTGPLKEHRAFHRAKRTSQLPMPLRVLFWNYALYVSGYTKAKNFGTFGVSSVSCFGANTLELLTPLTSSLNYGQVNSDGATLCRLTFDHRVVDGAEVARILGYIEEVINYQIQKELQFQLIPLVA